MNRRIVSIVLLPYDVLKMQEAQSRNSKSLSHILVIVILTGILLRLAGIFNDLWLDEIWALNVSSGLKSILEPFTASTLDGHSSLYSVILYFLGNGQSDYTYRLPAFFAAALSFIPLYQIVKSDNTFVRILTVTFFSCSFLFVLYGSEARPYSFMVLFGLLSFRYLEKSISTFSLSGCLIFNLSIVAGFLFHYSFVQFYTASLIWSVFEFLKKRGKNAISALLVLHILPCLLIGYLYFTQIRYLSPGTGPIGDYIDVIINTLSLSFGGPELSSLNISKSGFVMFGTAILFLVLLAECIMLLKESKQRGLFYLLILFLVPAIFVGIFKPKILLPRYFLMSILFSYFVLVSFINRVFKHGRVGKITAFLITFIFLYGNINYIRRFMHDGRGHYREAISYMVSQSGTQPVLVAGDQDFRHATVIYYYLQRPELKNKLLYLNQEEIPANSPQWYLLHSQDPNFVAPKTIKEHGLSFHIEKEFPFVSQSGWGLWLYKLESQAAD